MREEKAKTEAKAQEEESRRQSEQTSTPYHAVR